MAIIQEHNLHTIRAYLTNLSFSLAPQAPDSVVCTPSEESMGDPNLMITVVLAKRSVQTHVYAGYCSRYRQTADRTNRPIDCTEPSIRNIPTPQWAGTQLREA